MSAFEVAQHEAKMSKPSPAGEKADARETGKDGLHQKIIEWCNAQWPVVKFIHARTDRKSTIDPGAPDFILFMPQGRVLAIECKAKGGKLSPEQLAWAAQLRHLGHTLHVVRSLDDLQSVIRGVTPKTA